MNPANRVRLIGKLARNPKHGKGGKASWAMGSIMPDGGRGRIDFKAFRGPAEELATLGEGSRLRIEGHLEQQKPRVEGGKWELVVIAEELHVEMRIAPAAPAADEHDPDGQAPAGGAADDIG